MKTLIAAVAMMAAMMTLPLAAQQQATLSVAWDANSEPDLAGYRLYVRDISDPANPSQWTQVGSDIPVSPSPQYPITGAIALDTAKQVVVTAFNTFGLESDHSTPLNLPSKPADPPAEGGGSPSGGTLTTGTLTVGE